MRFNVFQCDTDVVWQRNPYPVLKTLLGAHNLLHQREVGHTVNGGVVYVQNAHPSGPVVWALQEMERRVRARASECEWQTRVLRVRRASVRLEFRCECAVSPLGGNQGTSWKDARIGNFP